MKFGLSFLPDCTGAGKQAHTYYQEAFQLCKEADLGGLEYIKMTEHFLHPYGGYCPSPLNFLSSVAVQTTRIRLMTGCILPSFHHPIQIAAETAMVDAISNGRLDVGFARAYLPYEFEAFNVEMDGSRNRYTETIQSVLDLWTKETVSVNNEFFNFSNAKNYPTLTQTPHPPVWGAAVNSRQSFAYLAENLFHLLITPPIGGGERLKENLSIYQELFRETAQEKQPLLSPNILMSIPLIIAPTNEEAYSLGEKYLSHYLKIWKSATFSLTQKTSLDYPNYQYVFRALDALTPSTMIESLHAFVGAPATILEAIEKVREKYPLTGMIWQIDFGEQPFGISKRTLDLFLNEVLPHVKTHKQESAFI